APLRGGSPPVSSMSGVSPPCSSLEPQPSRSNEARRKTTGRIVECVNDFIMIQFSQVIGVSGAASTPLAPLAPASGERGWTQSHPLTPNPSPPKRGRGEKAGAQRSG